MGYLTTFTLFNDDIDEVLKKPGEFCRELYQHAAGGGLSGSRFISLGHASRIAKAFKPRHASERTVYVQTGGSIYEFILMQGKPGN